MAFRFMSSTRQSLSSIGLVFGAMALLLAVVHFWGGPFSSAPPLEEVVAEKAVAIRDATIARLQGKELAPPPPEATWDADRIAGLATATLAALALILAVFGYARREPLRACGGAAVLGASALAFQLALVAIGAIVLGLIVVGLIIAFVGGG